MEFLSLNENIFLFLLAYKIRPYFKINGVIYSIKCIYSHSIKDEDDRVFEKRDEGNKAIRSKYMCYRFVSTSHSPVSYMYGNIQPLSPYARINCECICLTC